MSDENHIGARTSVENAHREDKERLKNAIESISDAFVLYDSDGKLVLFNQKHLNFYPHLADIYQPGVSREEIVRSHAAAIHEKDLAVSKEGYLEQRLAAINDPRPDTESELPDGRWVAVRERSVPGGGMVSVRTDITERKRIEQALQDSEEQLRAIFEHVPAAFFLKDAEGRYKFIKGLSQITPIRCYEGWYAEEPFKPSEAGPPDRAFRCVHDGALRGVADWGQSQDGGVLFSSSA